MLDVLYRVQGADFDRPIWAYDRATNSGAATSVAAPWQNAQQLPFMVLVATVIVTGGAAQYPERWYLRLTDAADAVVCELNGGQLASTIAAVATHIGTTFPPGLIVPPRYKVTGLGQFNAGAAANSCAVNVLGYYIPRGTLSFP